VILIDTSAWVEFLRDSGSSVADRVDELLGADCAVTDPIRMEVLAGAREEQHLERLRRLVLRCADMRVERADFDAAAAIWRTCRLAGETPRSLVDCLISAVAIRHAVPVCHADRDFDVIARHTDLEVDPAS
jgi:predicted nucleic acid-binding protein